MSNAAYKAWEATLGEVVNIRDYKRKEEKKPLTDLEKLACELMDVVVKDTATSEYVAPDKDPA